MEFLAWEGNRFLSLFSELLLCQLIIPHELFPLMQKPPRKASLVPGSLSCPLFGSWEVSGFLSITQFFLCCLCCIPLNFVCSSFQTLHPKPMFKSDPIGFWVVPKPLRAGFNSKIRLTQSYAYAGFSDCSKNTALIWFFVLCSWLHC